VSPILDAFGKVIGASKIARDVSDRVAMQSAADEYTINTEKLAAVGATVASTLDRETVVQKVTDTATELTHAEFGAFFYNVHDRAGGAYMLYSLSGASRDAFDHHHRLRQFRPSAAWDGADGVHANISAAPPRVASGMSAKFDAPWRVTVRPAIVPTAAPNATSLRLWTLSCNLDIATYVANVYAGTATRQE